MKTLTVGIIAPNDDTAESLKGGIAATGMGKVVINSGEYSSNKTDRTVRQFSEVNPEVVIVEIRDHAEALRCLKTLYSVLPKTYFLVASNLTDPQLIIEAMRSGAREFLPLPVTQSGLIQVFTRYLSEVEQRAASEQLKRGKIYSVISPKPGSGATTLSLNLAGIIAESSKCRVGVLDLNQPVGDAAAYLNMKPMFTVTETMAAIHRLDSTLLESFMTPANGFHLLAGLREYTATSQFTGESLSQLFEVSSQTFAHTFVDLSEYAADAEAQVIASMSAAILLVVTPDVPSIWRTERLLNSLNKTNASNKIKIVLNRKSRHDQISESDVEKLLNHSVDFSLPNDYLASIKALNAGRLLDPKEGKHLARAYRDLAEQLAGLPPPESRRGLLGMFLKTSSAGGSTNA